jgi:hypothetical protein
MIMLEFLGGIHGVLSARLGTTARQAIAAVCRIVRTMSAALNGSSKSSRTAANSLALL